MRHVNLSAVQHILALCNKEDQSVANVAAELIKVKKVLNFKIIYFFNNFKTRFQVAFGHLKNDEKSQILESFDPKDAQATYLRLSISLMETCLTDRSRKYIMRLVLHDKVGVAALESLKKFPPPTEGELEGR